MKAVRKHVSEKWILLYIERWLKAPVQYPDGSALGSDKGTPQGGVISPLLANLFLHYAFDRWMVKYFPDNSFARYADDAVVHCRTEEEAEYIKSAIEVRMRECNLELHPEKTKIIYCSDDSRREEYPVTEFDFLGFTFRKRSAKNKTGKLFNSFSPTVSKKSLKSFSDKMRDWYIYRKSDLSIFDIARICNPMLRGWINYFGCVYKSALVIPLRRFNSILYQWARRKFKKLNTKKRFFRWLEKISGLFPDLFVHWKVTGVGIWFVQ
jgi:RNA-directed DNA polymerase